MAETIDPTEQPDVQQEQAEHAGLHRAFLDDLIRQIRTGMVDSVSVANGKQPILFHPLGHGGENVVLSGMRLPLDGMPYDLPFVLKVGLHEASDEALHDHRARILLLREYMRDAHWMPNEHAMLHTSPDGRQRLIIVQQPVNLEGTQRLSCGYAELRTDWNQREIGTLCEPATHTSGLPLLPRTHPHVQRYARVNTHLVMDCGEEHDAPVGRDEFLQTQQSKPLASLMNALRRDGGLRATMRTFVERVIAYSDETDEIIDILGEGDNVLLTRRSMHGREQCTPVLLDALHPTPRCLHRLPDALMRLSAERSSSNERADVIDALNGLNYVRTMNALARALNLDKRVMRWRRRMTDNERKNVDFTLVWERCRKHGACEEPVDTTGVGAQATEMPVPVVSKWHYVWRKAD